MRNNRVNYILNLDLPDFFLNTFFEIIVHLFVPGFMSLFGVYLFVCLYLSIY